MASSAAQAAGNNVPVLGDKKPARSPASTEILIRPARLSDAPVMGRLCHEAYSPSPVTDFLLPKWRVYPEDSIRAHRQTCQTRFFNPRSCPFVAVLATDPATVVGHGTFVRLGDDEGAKQLVRSRGLGTRLWMFVLSWFFYFYHMVENLIYPDRITDKANFAEFMSWVAADNELHWKSHPERWNRWHAQHIIVKPVFQGRGIGKKIMLEGLKIAQRERVIMSLVASVEGEKLYRNVGFQLLGRFKKTIPRGDTSGGGIMIWYPEGAEQQN